MEAPRVEIRTAIEAMKSILDGSIFATREEFVRIFLDIAKRVPVDDEENKGKWRELSSFVARITKRNSSSVKSILGVWIYCI